jgi:hypothetical protein
MKQERPATEQLRTVSIPVRGVFKSLHAAPESLHSVFVLLQSVLKPVRAAHFPNYSAVPPCIDYREQVDISARMKANSRWLVVAICLGAARFTLAADTARFTSICGCVYTNAPCAGDFRWNVKTETNQPPKTGIKKLTPTAMAHWPDLAPDPVSKTYKSNAPRFPQELKWYELTGRVTLIKAEPDGDLHIQMQDKSGTNGSVNIVVEIPASTPWCGVRTTAFSLTTEQPPFNAPNKLTLSTNAVIRVVGRAFYDGTHSVTNHPPNQRMDKGNPLNVTIWEIHPVMKLDVMK